MSAEENTTDPDGPELLAEAVRVLTAAARLTYQPLKQAQDGTWQADPDGRPQQGDWAEFVTLALAGAAANFGGVDAVLHGRPGSWEADGVRQLLTSSVGHDEAHLWEHRTDPLTITLYVDEILSDVAPEFWRGYDEAQRELAARYDAIGIPSFTSRPGMTKEEIDAGHATLTPATPDQEAADEAIGDLEERLEAQRLDEVRAYGEALKVKVLEAAAAVPGLDVPVQVVVDLDTYRPTPQHPDGTTLEGRLVTAAQLDTPTPDDLAGTPLTRLEGTRP